MAKFFVNHPIIAIVISILLVIVGIVSIVQLPLDVRNQGVTIRKSPTSPLALFSLYSPKGTYDATFLANYAYININDPMSRVPGIGQVSIFGAGQYAMRFWVRPDTLASLGITVSDIAAALTNQNKVNPSGQIGAEPVPRGQQFTYTVRAQGRLLTAEEFGDVVVRANPDGSIVRMKDVARVELGAQSYNQIGRLNGNPSAIIAVYQLPGSNAIDTMNSAKQLMDELKQRFPEDLDYTVSLDTTLAVSEGIKEIVQTLVEALILVVLVVFIFLQNWRATLIPLLAVPVSLVGTFAVFPLLGFSINTLSLFGLVLAIGLVVDDAIVVVEAVEQHIEHGLSPRDATLKAMEEVSGPIVAIALVLAAVFLPAAFVGGITGRLNNQFAVTIAISTLISAFNALTLSPALAALLLKPGKQSRGLLGWFFDRFNSGFGKVMHVYLVGSDVLLHKVVFSVLLLVVVALAAGFFGSRLPTGLLPEEDQGYFFLNVQLPTAASLQRTDDVAKKIEAILKDTPGVQTYNTVVGFSLLSFVNTTYNAFYFVTLKPWGERGSGLTADVILRNLNQRLAAVPEAQIFGFSPPAIPGIGTSGGATFMLEDRSGQGVEFLAQNTDRFLQAARQRPEFASLTSTFIPSAPQVFADVDRDKVLKQGVDLDSVYQTLQTFMGGLFVNYFNRFGRVWQVYVQAEGASRRQGCFRDHDFRVFAAFCVSHSCRALRELVAAVLNTVDGSDRGARRVQWFMAAPFSFRCLLASRSDRAHRAGGEERDPDRRIREDRVREGTKSDRRGAGRNEDTPSGNIHDIVRVHSRMRAVVDRFGRGELSAPNTGHRRDHGNGLRHALRELTHSGFVLRDRATRAPWSGACGP